jgi:hypothetical protein
MAKAYICDRCKDSHEGGAEARVFLESHVLKRQQCARGSAVLVAFEDLCGQCTTEVMRCIKQRPPRTVGELPPAPALDADGRVKSEGP